MSRPLLTTLAAAGILAATTATWAHMDSGQGRLLPYEGHLDLDGAPQQGSFDFRFGLFGTEAADASCLAEATLTCTAAKWSEQASGVPVNAGTFSVALGSTQPLGDAVLASDDLYLAIAVRKGADPFTVLSGKQRLLGVPFAARAAAAKNYSVTGKLEVGGEIQGLGKITGRGGLELANGAGPATASIDPAGKGTLTGLQLTSGAVSYGPVGSALESFRLVAREDFESAPQGWRRQGAPTTERTYCAGLGTNILGGSSSNKELTKTFSLPVPHSEVLVHVTYLMLDTWDSEWGFVDLGNVDGVASVNCWRDQVHGNDPWVFMGALCGTTFDAVRSVTCKLPHTTGELFFRARANLDGTATDESFGIDNVEIWVR